MTIQGGIVEQKTIGVRIGTNGTFVNTILNNGKVELSKIENTNLYHSEGEWISEVVDIGDNFKEFGKVFVTNIDDGNSNIEVLTRTSDDGIVFDSWLKVGDTNDIESVKRRYISIKIIFHAGTSLVDDYISRFNVSSDFEKFNNGEYIDTSNGLVLKREYLYPMEVESSWSEDGLLVSKVISKNDFTRIDKLKINPSTLSSKTLILNGISYLKYNELNKTWSEVSQSAVTSTQINAEGMGSISPLLDRNVTSLNPKPMLDISNTLTEDESGKLFSKTIELNKYLDIRSVNFIPK